MRRKNTMRKKQSLSIFLKKISTFLFLAYLIAFSGCQKRPHAEYVVAIDPNWFPMDVPGKEPYILAFSKELLQKIGEKEGVALNRVTVSWDNILEGLNKKEYQGILSLMQPYVFNKEKYDFSENFLETGPVIVMKQTATSSSVDTLYEKEIAIFSPKQETLVIQRYPDALIRLYDSVATALVDVAIGNIDAALIDSIEAHAYVLDIYKGQLKIVSKPLNDQGIKLVTLAKTNQKLVKIFNDGLEALKKEGEYAKLLKKWGLGS